MVPIRSVVILPGEPHNNARPLNASVADAEIDEMVIAMGTLCRKIAPRLLRVCFMLFQRVWFRMSGVPQCWRCRRFARSQLVLQ